MSLPKSPKSRSGLQKVLGGIIPALVKPVVAAADRAMRRTDVSLRRELERRAVMESADIVSEEMPGALYCASRFINLDYALSLRKPGLILEFGVAGGKSVTHIANLCPDERVYGFDSFQGLPEHWSGNRFSYRNFTQGGVLPKVPGNVKLVPGWFNETLPGFLAAHPEPVGFLHIDCDIYSSTQYVLEVLKEQLQPGCVIVFDEFFNYPGFQLHEYRAFHEFIRMSGRKFQFASFAGNQASVILE